MPLLLIFLAAAAALVAANQKPAQAPAPPPPAPPAPTPPLPPAPTVAWPTLPPLPVPPAPPAPPVPQWPQIPTVQAPFDATLPADKLAAVQTALTSEKDPRALRAFAGKLREAGFPVAAAALETKAQVMAVAQAAKPSTTTAGWNHV